MKILYVISFYDALDGASTGLYTQVECDKEIYSDYLVVAKNIISTQDNFHIVLSSEREIINKFIHTEEKIVVHYIKAGNSPVFYEIMDLFETKPLVVTTCTQSPSYLGLWLSPFEIRNSNYFVFIDKTAYKNPLIQFIPEKFRSQVYLAGFGIYTDFSKVKKTDNKGRIVYGRGSSLIKCPRDMFEVFDKIKVENKLFRVVGISEGDNWVREEAAKRDDVEVYERLPDDKWVEMCNSFDVFLYQLPFDSYASIDGTLGLAMLLEKPCVYMGCEAPKERFYHGDNGFVASSVDEMAEFATMLGNDANLRKRIGQRGRVTVLADCKPEVRVAKYTAIYNEYLNENVNIPVPLVYRIRFIKHNPIQFIIGIKHEYPILSKILRLVKRLLFNRMQISRGHWFGGNRLE